MYSFDGIVLKRSIIKETSIYLTLFTKEYWKITAWDKDNKKRVQVDIWWVYNFSSTNDKQVNKIENSKPKILPDISKLNYTCIENLLLICSYLDKLLANWMQYESIYEDYISTLKFMQNNETSALAKELFILRMSKKLWIAKDIDKWWSKNLFRMYSVIDIYSIDNLNWIKWLDVDDVNVMKSYNESNIFNFLN